MKNFLFLISLIGSLCCISCSSYVVMSKEKPVSINADTQNATLVIYRSTAYKYNLVVSNYLNDRKKLLCNQSKAGILLSHW